MINRNMLKNLGYKHVIAISIVAISGIGGVIGAYLNITPLVTVCAILLVCVYIAEMQGHLERKSQSMDGGPSTYGDIHIDEPQTYGVSPVVEEKILWRLTPGVWEDLGIEQALMTLHKDGFWRVAGEEMWSIYKIGVNAFETKEELKEYMIRKLKTDIEILQLAIERTKNL